MLKTIKNVTAAVCGAVLCLTPVASDAQVMTPDLNGIEDFYNKSWTSRYQGTPLSTAGYTQTFYDDFSKGANCPEIGNAFDAAQPGVIWWAQSHAPAANGSGSFIGINGANNPYSCAGGHLTMTMSYANGAWNGAQISTLAFNGAGTGYVQGKGVVTIKAKFPALPTGFVPWASFWFESTLTHPDTIPDIELDLFESGLRGVGVFIQQLTSFWHHNGPNIATGTAGATMIQSTPLLFNMFDGLQHSYSVKFGDFWDVIYIDNAEVLRWPVTSADERIPMALLIDTTAPPVGITAVTTTTWAMEIDSVQAWSCQSTACD